MTVVANPVVRRWPVLAAGLVGLLLLGLVSACHRADSASTTPVAEPEPAVDREAKARDLLMYFRGAALEEKLEGLSEVAHVYWDTNAAPEAWKHLVFYLLDARPAQPTRALKELESFVRRRPESFDVVITASILGNALAKMLHEEPDHPDVVERRKLLGRAVDIWIGEATRFLADPKHANDYALRMDLGGAYLLAERWAEAEKTWAGVASMAPPPGAFQRFTALHRRAELFREKLADPARALALYREAMALAPELDDGVDPRVIAFVEAKVDELSRGD